MTRTDTSDWNPRYLAYCRAQGRTPDEQIAHDRATFPGGFNAGFLCWMSEQRRAFFRAAPDAFMGRKVDGPIADQARWDAFLMQGADTE